MFNPFLIKDDIISLQLCDDIINDLFVIELLDTSVENHKTFQITDESIFNIFKDIVRKLTPSINSHFNVEINEITEIFCDYFKNNTQQTKFISDNSFYVQKQWVRNKFNDFTIVLFLNSYCDGKGFDPSMEVVGGQLLFPQHKIQFTPSAGSALIYPSDPHFINCNLGVIGGQLFQIKILVSCKQMYIYNPKGATNDTN